MEEFQSPSQTNTLPVKYDWYQSDSNVVITILVKNVDTEKSKIKFDEDGIDISLVLADGSTHERKLLLAYPINWPQSIYNFMSTKIEVKVTKLSATRWNTLEKEQEAKPTGDQGPPKYPTSKPGKDWNNIEKNIAQDMEKDKPIAEEALNQLFQEIYSKGGENVQKAMNKSFVESCGTVLSTNWADISKEKVQVRPPDSMEFKKWDS